MIQILIAVIILAIFGMTDCYLLGYKNAQSPQEKQLIEHCTLLTNVVAEQIEYEKSIAK